MAKKQVELRITGRARPFSDDEAKLFNHAVALVVAHGRQESMFVADAKFGELANADIGEFRIERMVLADNSANRTVEIGVAHEGRAVFQASFEQWRRPRRRGEVSIACAVPAFVRGDWEKAFLALPVPAR